MSELIVLSPDATTSSEHGSHPAERSVSELLDGSVILLDKPAGPTSHQVSAWARDVLGLTKLGHGGTLDPMATGLLPLMCGKAMRLTGNILTHTKSYIAVLSLSSDIPTEQVELVINNLSGEIYNVPPIESAVKVQVRTRTLSRIELLERESSNLLLKVEAEAGTYIRTLARDLGLLIGAPVSLKELRRDRSGSWELSDAITLQQLSDAFWVWKQNGDDSALKRILIPIEELVSDFPRVTVSDGAVAGLAHGSPLHRPGVVSLPSNLNSGDTVAFISLKQELVSIGTVTGTSTEIKNMSKGEVGLSQTVLMGQDTYPKTW